MGRVVSGIFSVVVLASVCGVASAQDNTCGAVAKVQTQDLSIAPDLDSPSSYLLGGANGVLTQAYNQTLSVNSLITRLKISNCRSLASAAPVRLPGDMVDAATYKPRTEFDNTPWRFDMTQNGKRMTADEFDEWMKAKGVRVAKGAPQPQPAAVAPGTAPSQGATVPAKPD